MTKCGTTLDATSSSQSSQLDELRSFSCSANAAELHYPLIPDSSENRLPIRSVMLSSQLRHGLRRALADKFAVFAIKLRKLLFGSTADDSTPRTLIFPGHDLTQATRESNSVQVNKTSLLFLKEAYSCWKIRCEPRCYGNLELIIN